MSYTPTNWQNLPDTTTPVVAQKLNNMENGIEKSDKVIGGDEYDSTATYEIGDYCIYNNKLYRCTTAISTAEAFTPAHWEETSVENELDALRKSGGIPTNSVIGYDGSTIPSGFEETDGPNDYSTTEKRIGTWIDSKPLYRRVFTGTTSSSTYIIFGNIPNINKVISIRGTIIGSGGAVNDTIPNYWDNNTKNIIQCNPSSGDVFITYGSTYQNRNFIVIVEYTKTTD